MKFEIFQSEGNEKFYFRLKAKNGQIILSSQGYSSKAGCKNGIESVKTNCGDDACYERKTSTDGKPYFSLLAKNKQVIGNSQRYASKDGCENGIKSVKNTAPDAEIVDLSVAS